MLFSHPLMINGKGEDDIGYENEILNLKDRLRDLNK